MGTHGFCLLERGLLTGRSPVIVAEARRPDLGQLRVRELCATDASRWNAFVELCDAATFFHYAEWKDILENVLGHECRYLYSESNGCITGILPLAHISSRLFGNVLVSLPFLVYGGVAANDCSVEEALVSTAVKVAENMRVDFVELRNRQQSSRNWIEKSTHVTFRKSIDADPERNFLSIPRKQRAMVRKGMAAGLQSHSDPEISRLAPVLLECKRNLGTPFFGDKYLNAVRQTFGDKVEITTVTKGSEPVASVMSFRFRDEILPYYGGGRAAARGLFANDFMYWSVMKRACQAGVRTFDFGRSQRDSGSYHFKKHWGFEPKDLCYECMPIGKNRVPTLSPGDPKYAFAVRLWKRLPLPIARHLGPPLARLLY